MTSPLGDRDVGRAGYGAQTLCLEEDQEGMDEPTCRQAAPEWFTLLLVTFCARA